MTSYATTIYQCPRCRAELGHQYLVSSNTFGREFIPAARGNRPPGELHPEIRKIKDQLESAFPLFYTDSFVFDIYMSQYLELGRCGSCSVLFRPGDYELSTESHGFYRLKDRVKKEEDFRAKYGVRDLMPGARLVDAELQQTPSLVSGRDFLRDVSRESWVSSTVERLIRLAALIQMNHHRRPMTLPQEWGGWPLPDELSSFDWDVIESLGGGRSTPSGLTSRLAYVQADVVPTRPKYLERRSAFGDDESIPRPWLSEQAKIMIGEASSCDWPADGLRTPLSYLEKLNIAALIDLLGETDNERLMKAECFRSLGDFDACLSEIGLLTNSDSAVGIAAKTIKEHALKADSYVALVDERKFVREVESERSTITFSIPSPAFGHMPDIGEETISELPGCGCQIKASLLGRRVYLESETGRVQAEISLDFATLTDEECKNMLAFEARKALPRTLGETTDGQVVSAGTGRFGPYVRYGDKYVSLRDEDDPYTINLARALELIEKKEIADAQRIILDFEEDGIQVLSGRYGPYITHKNKKTGDRATNARVPKDRDPKSLTLEECEKLLAAAEHARQTRSKRSSRKPSVASFAEHGIYVVAQKSTYYVIDWEKDLRVSVPEETDPSSMTLEDCQKLLEHAAPVERRIKNFAADGIYIWEFRVGGAHVIDRRTGDFVQIPKDRNPSDLTLQECRQLLSGARE